MDVAATNSEETGRKWRLRLPERLPNLKGWWLTLYTIIWAIMLPIAVIGAVRGSYITLTTPTMWSPYGFATTEDSKGLHVDSVITPEVRATGMQAGDYVVAIDEWAVPPTAARAAARPRVVKLDGESTTFTIRKPSGQLTEIRLVRSRAIEDQRFRDAGLSFVVARAMAFAGSLLIPALFIPAAILLFLRRRREAVPACLSLAFLLIASIVNGGDLLGLSIGMLEAVATVATFLLFSALYAFPSGRFEPRWTVIPFLLLFPSLFIWSPLLDLGFQLLAVAVLISRYRLVGPGAERLQLRWAFLGLIVGLLLLGLNFAGEQAVIAFQAEDPRWLAWEYALISPLMTLSLCTMALGLIVSILRYRLYDADAAIGRSAAFGVLTVGFVALFAASEKLIELIGQEYLGQNMGALAGGIGAALAAVAIAPMHNRVHRWAERRFQKALYKLRHGLPALVGDLRETAGLEEVAGATLHSVVDGVRASRAALIVDGDLVDAREIAAAEVNQWSRHWTPSVHDGVDYDQSDPFFPVRVPLEAEGHGRVGWLLLGPRPDGSLFGKAECQAIEEIAESVARAIEVTVKRAEREAKLEARLKALEAAVARLSPRAGKSLA
jgi:hypothetical protein